MRLPQMLHLWSEASGLESLNMESQQFGALFVMIISLGQGAGSIARVVAQKWEKTESMTGTGR